MTLQADTELLESVCENNKSLERMTSITPAQPVEVPSATLSRYVGVYDVLDDDGQTSAVEVTLSDATLWLDYGAKGREPLTALSPTQFSWSGAIVEFSTPAGGVVNLLLRYVEGDERGQRRAR